ncbi:unnamed protein product [Trichogramma brassicae]|uniref:DNA mismatch repair protein S5 domain-containing protein n=1 Tax=Trichogramma brassicae TaxID=86971 RepID=A0A6H5IIR4_9HYME|nr:unnamed protein product [Trichogramma brassicae]
MSIPGKIRKLDEVVVNRIAAGEIIQRPANALKELIENSLDAGSTNITVSVKEGGLKLLQIQDNGSGINKEDMDIVCERFTTSKLQSFDDLQKLTTFGFRGEALASISHVAQLTITTKTAKEKCAYKAGYIDGVIKGPPVPCAGNQGTTITVENLFYNIATRRKALSDSKEEYSRIQEVVSRYAIHYPNTGFTLKKHGENRATVRTPTSSTKKENIKIIFGNDVARDLMEINVEERSYRFKAIIITSPNYAMKRFTFLLFINNRLVESTAIKKAFESVYVTHLAKNSHPWCYLSLQIDPQNIDVNIHPTKHEVKFLHEGIIIGKISTVLNEEYAKSNKTRTFYIDPEPKKRKLDLEKVEKEILPPSQGDTKKLYPKNFVRVDHNSQKLEKFNFTSNTNNDSFEETRAKKRKLQEEPVEKLKEKELSLDKDESDTTVKIAEQKTILIDKDNEKLDEAALNSNFVKNSLKVDNIDKISEAAKKPDKSAKETEIKEESMKKLIIDNENEIHKVIKENVRNEIETKNPRNSEIIVQKNNSDSPEENIKSTKEANKESKNVENKSQSQEDDESFESPGEFKSYSVNQFRVETKLLSILELRQKVEQMYNPTLRKLLSKLVFVGCINETSALIQSGVGLYFCDTKRLVEELFYEIMLYDFANFGVLKFSEPLLIKDVAMLGLEHEDAGWSEEIGEKTVLAERVQELLLEKADMLRQYFSINIDKKGQIRGLPILLENHFPNQGGLPMYLLRLATEVNWSKEKACFRDICRETAQYYSQIDISESNWKHKVEHILYAAIKDSLLPPKFFAENGTIYEVTTLPDLYRIFERC